MKKNKEIPLKGVVQFAKNFTSTGSAFILATLGVITQTFHNAFLAFELSSFEDFWLRLFQAVLASFFVSGALLYFTVRSANSDDKTIKQLVWFFFAFEFFCNVYYWANKYIILPWGTDKVVWTSMIIALPFSFMIPFSIKAYAGELKFDEEEFDEDDISESKFEEVKEILNRQDDKINTFIDDNNTDSFLKNGEKLDLKISTEGDNGTSVVKVLKATIEKNKDDVENGEDNNKTVTDGE